MAEPVFVIEKRDDGQLWATFRGEDWGLLTEPQFDFRMDSYSTECEVSFRMIHRPKPKPDPKKKSYTYRLGLRKPGKDYS
ncbi:hypothetical protein SEA_PANAMAXUS_37 [Mycobacterium phage Panamaxus]|uniref:Uncharacterized protein n=1 Tax=Mycobacterium phage Veracruz TaxID=2530154 RepID=A0A481VTH3_9CAUD|nr:hypothetical protein KIP27_gp54 [Mycobacterium phage Veracruz]AIS73712.1 hypothetical protein PBI_QUINNKIRO_38 [Mycobacterium phage QuinnKiro]ALA11841.1 hypothetical protein SEA_TEXAGE_38 [Mycobacterium phage Texage]AOT24188.1 hypothetical protein SEA_TODACORO_39 [Mycobacterium phage Todacoro]AOT25541.1 hypothetical protein SEA_MARGO_39 [Mycobacterium phage Margo]AUX82335.1 hypothetical protein SEA_LAMBERT1_39 [Mycobacterium phage Lambert1]AVP42956.1 hypothetical protein SEA_PANAMAXUS_37 [